MARRLATKAQTTTQLRCWTQLILYLKNQHVSIVIAEICPRWKHHSTYICSLTELLTVDSCLIWNIFLLSYFFRVRSMDSWLDLLSACPGWSPSLQSGRAAVLAPVNVPPSYVESTTSTSPSFCLSSPVSSSLECLSWQNPSLTSTYVTVVTQRWINH